MNGSNTMWGRTGCEVIYYQEILISTTGTLEPFFLKKLFWYFEYLTKIISSVNFKM